MCFLIYSIQCLLLTITRTKKWIGVGQLPSTFPAYNETANKHGGANEKQVAKHKETKEAAAKLMSGHKRSGLPPFARRVHMRVSVCVCVCVCVYACVNRWRWAQRVCVWNKQWRVWGGSLPASLSLPLARSLLCVTSESEACWLDLHLIQLVSSISATPKNSQLFSRLQRHLILGNATPRAADTYTHTYARKHTRARGTWYLGLAV